MNITAPTTITAIAADSNTANTIVEASVAESLPSSSPDALLPRSGKPSTVGIYSYVICMVYSLAHYIV